LRETQAELAHVNRVTTMGQLAASIFHEVMQPLTAGITKAQAALNWLRAEPPELDEVQRALGRVVEAGNRTTDIMNQILALFRKTPPRKEPVDDVIRRTAIASSMRSTRRKLTAWAWGYPFAVRSSSSTVGASRPLAKPALARPFSSRCLSEALDTKLRRRVPRFSSRGLRRGANDRLSS
jgi:signal transduction histidine kinase